ncbi:MAG: Gfo/Idh/MocA family oxidoreductase [Sedimentisphaerales bacterium]|nr:Gfo/Idh/MocA family oxidoreductase [Sedimentisphaerales bacterium]
MKMKEESKNFQTRRDFLQSAAVTGTTLILSPMISAQEESEKTPDDINIALIGAGAQGQVLLNACRNIPGIRFKAVCDIWENYNRKRTARILKAYGHNVNEYEDYKQMLAEENNLDAAIIATPDFCHAEQTIACLQAGLHVYCEKEMAKTIEEAQKMVQAARQTGKLLQIGRQRRSSPRYIHCYQKLMKEYGLFGQIKAVNGQWNRKIYDTLGWPVNAPIAQETLTKYGYNSMQQFRNWQWYKALGNGRVVDFGAHQIDIFNWFLEATPKAITANGNINYNKYGYEWYDTVLSLIEYDTPHGNVSASYQTMPYDEGYKSYEKFIGDQGTFWISEHNSRNMIYPEPTAENSKKWYQCVQDGDLIATNEIMKMLESMDPENFAHLFRAEETPPPVFGEENKSEINSAVIGKPSLHLPLTLSDKPYTQPHLENFFDTIRGKAQLNCPAELGYKTAAAVLKINEAIETGRKIEFKPDDFVV